MNVDLEKSRKLISNQKKIHKNGEMLFPKNFGDISTFGVMGTEILFFVKNEKRVGVRNDDIISKVFQFYTGLL